MENLENRYDRKALTLNIEGKEIKGTVIEYRTCENELLKKIRRRVEDRLRKADQYEILRCAHSLRVKMT